MEYSGGTQVCHVVAMPYPSRGHINPMMNFCKLLVSRKHDILITFVVTEEWLGYIGADPKPDNIRFATVPNVIPPERLKAADFPGFYEAVMTKLEAPFEQLIDRLGPPVTSIVADIELRWAIGLGNRRHTPVAAFWTMSATVLSMFHHLDLHLKQQINGTVHLIEKAGDIAGLSSNTVGDLRTIFRRDDPRVLQLALECIAEVEKAQYLLFSSVYELEPQIIDTFKSIYQFPIYTIGPAIPYLELETKISSGDEHYIKWLDSQPEASVLYISMGSFLSVSTSQMEEIAAGLKASGVRFLWIVRVDAAASKIILNEEDPIFGMVIPWCDQLKVLSHRAIGGVWTHCGWNSTLEAVFAGVPLLTFPLFLDQDTNSRQIVEDWAIGLRMSGGADKLLTGEEIAGVVGRFMDLHSDEVMEIRRKARELGEICHLAISKTGSSLNNLDAFIKNISL